MTEKIKILGPPGTGKTYTMMGSYAHKLTTGYKATDITCTTFRKQAAHDLIKKVQQWADYKDIKDHVSTMHGICYRLLGYPDVIESKHIREFAKAYKYEHYMKNPNLSTVAEDDEIVYSGKLLDLYGWLRNTRTPAEKWYRYPGRDNISLPAAKVPDFIADYDRYKAKNGLIDFSDMIEIVLNDKIRLDTPVLMVDEFQDLTRQQYELFQMWQSNAESVIIAGDPLQSLYGFWGGSPDYFREWEGKEVILHNSHRLQSDVWNLAKGILRTERQNPPDVSTKDGNKSISHINSSDKWPMHEGDALHLVRCNYQAGAIAMRLAESGIVFGGLKSVAWSDCEISLFNAILRARQCAPMFSRDMLALIDSYPAKYFKYTGRKSDFLEYLKSEYRPTLAEMNPHIKPELYNIIKSDNPAAYMSNCGNLKYAKINNAIKHLEYPIIEDDLKRTQILTIHGAKGLEADTVYLHTAITPRIRKNILIPCDESAAEARVWYVGVTRAKQWLYVVNDEGHNYKLPAVVA